MSQKLLSENETLRKDNNDLHTQLTADQSRVVELERLLKETQDKHIDSECRVLRLEQDNARLTEQVKDLQQAFAERYEVFNKIMDKAEDNTNKLAAENVRLQHDITEREARIQSMGMRIEQLVDVEKDNARLRELLRECAEICCYHRDLYDRIKAAIWEPTK